MARHTAAETTNWVASNLRRADDVLGVDVLSDYVLRVSRKHYAPYVAGVLSTERVEEADIRPLVESKLRVDIIANVPKESYWTGEALNLARNNNIATGFYADLLRVINVPDVRSYRPSETEFIERSLRQHDRILSFDRIHDRLYRIKRTKGLIDLTVAMLNEYELTADHLRTARDRYGRFEVAVITNPNGKATTSAEETAQNLGCEILKWGPFLGRLNKK